MDVTFFWIAIGVVINGLFTGLGVALGTYIANKHIIEKTKKLVRKIKR